METLWQDLKYGARQLACNPGFTAVAVLTLALGIGANTAIFSVVNAVLLRPQQQKSFDRVVILWESNFEHEWLREEVSGPNFTDWRRQATVFEDMAAGDFGDATLVGWDEPEQVRGARVTPSFFQVFDVDVALGRKFSVGEERAPSSVVILSHGLWQRRFGASPRIIGRSIELDATPYTVIGVLSADFWFPLPVDVLVPFDTPSLDERSRLSHDLGVFARLKPGVTLVQAQSEMDVIAQRLSRQQVEQRGWGVTVDSAERVLVGYIRPALLVLLAAVGFVLLIACANVANLLLVRAAGRQREMAVRVALGAGRWRVMQQMLVESLLLSAMGSAAGVLLGLWGLDLLSAVLPSSVPVLGAPAAAVSLARISPGVSVLFMALVLTLLTGAFFSAVPALQATRLNLGESLKEGGRSSSEGLGRQRVRSALVVAQLALALVLLVGAGLMIQSFRKLNHVNPGFQPNHVLAGRVHLPEARYLDRTSQAAFFHRVLARLKSMPGVRAAGATNIVPMERDDHNRRFTIEGRPSLAPGEFLAAEYRWVTPDFFTAMGMAAVRGRVFEEFDDSAQAAPVAVISEAMARRYWPDENPLGRRIRIAGRSQESAEIIGVVSDVRHFGLSQEPRPILYVPFGRAARREAAIVLRVDGAPLRFASTLKAAVEAEDPGQPVFSIRAMEEIVAESISATRLLLVLLGLFGALAVALTAVGVYGVVSYSVSQRTHEIGIRMTLGANRTDIFRLVVGQGAKLALMGVGIGLAGALGVTRFLASLLYGISATDAATFSLVALFLTLIALLACWIPALRAMRVDPMTALRYE